MNKQRRSAIKRLMTDIQAFMTGDTSQKDDILGEIEEIKEEEEEYFDNMPENLQMSERADNSQSAISALEMAYDSFESDDFDSALDNLSEAAAC
jgi:anion-transporting  ArsA/GET3 family ATPase